MKAQFNPFVPNAPFLYPLKTSENLKVSCFHGVEKGCSGDKWVNCSTNIKNTTYVLLTMLWFNACSISSFSSNLFLIDIAACKNP